MKRVLNNWLTRVVVLIAIFTATCGCLRQDLVFFEDGEWDISDYREGAERELQNSDIDNDDMDR